MTRSTIEVFESIQASWPPGYKLEIAADADELIFSDGHPFSQLLARFRDGKACSLPFFGRNKVNWVTFGGGQEELLETLEDIRSWILPYLGEEDAEPIVTLNNFARPQEIVLCGLAGWYFRWSCPQENFLGVLKRFKALFILLKSRSTVRSMVPPSLSGLRLNFVAAVSTGDWIAANTAVDAIDEWELDTARNTLLMRIRMLFEEGNLESVLTLVKGSEILKSTLPSRVREMVIEAIYEIEILPVEVEKSWSDAVAEYARIWRSRLAQFVIIQRGLTPNFPLAAYEAFLDGDREYLKNIFMGFGMRLAGEMLATLPLADISHDTSEQSATELAESPPSIGGFFWAAIKDSVEGGSQTNARECIAGLSDAILDDPDWISLGAETLLELFTDPKVLGSLRLKVIAEEVLVAIVDVVINSRSFPRREHAPMYDALIGTWVAVRGDSSLDQDGQLLLGLLGAAIQCSTSSVPDCELAIRSWWGKRRVISRLGWLVVALETLIENHSDPTRLQDIWSDGAEVIRKQSVPLSKAGRRLWMQLGRSVGFNEESVRSFISPLTEAEELLETDSLSDLGLKRIAIVSLQERAARKAAEELKIRTGAEILVVTSLAADDLARSAVSADLILFVWASCTHAVYRAFDHVRGKLQYVQGTGPSSIVLAAERWAIQRQCE